MRNTTNKLINYRPEYWTKTFLDHIQKKLSVRKANTIAQPIIDNETFFTNLKQKAYILNDYVTNEFTINDNGSIFPTFIPRTNSLLSYVSLTKPVQRLNCKYYQHYQDTRLRQGICRMLKSCAALTIVENL